MKKTTTTKNDGRTREAIANEKLFEAIITRQQDIFDIIDVMNLEPELYEEVERQYQNMLTMLREKLNDRLTMNDTAAVLQGLDRIEARMFQRQFATQQTAGLRGEAAIMKALEVVCNGVEGDASQLSEPLRQWAEKHGWL